MGWLKNKSNQVVDSYGPRSEESQSVTWESLSRCSTEQARKLIPYKTALTLDVLPLGVINLQDGQILSVAAARAVDPKLQQTLHFLTDLRVKLIAVDPSVLRRAIFVAYNQSDNFLEPYQYESDFRPQEPAILEQELECPSGEAATLLHKLINYAISRDATDLMIIPASNGLLIYLKIHGELYSHTKPIGATRLRFELLNRLKVLAKLDTTQRFTPQDGRISWRCGKELRSIRIHTVPTLHGEKAVLRILGADETRTITELGTVQSIQKLLERYLNSNRGALLVGGSTGSGKSTTLYAVVRELSNRGKHVVTIEDPIEIPITGASQSEIDLARGYDYPTAIKAALRQGPDVLMIGELRDGVSAVTAMQGALVGHKLLATVHGGDVFEMLLRLKHFGVDVVTLASTAQLILCQRLISKLCSRCKKTTANRARRGPGCTACSMSGLSGRALIVEALWITSELRELIIDGEISATRLRAATSDSNYIGIEPQIEQLILEGVIDEDTLEDVALE